MSIFQGRFKLAQKTAANWASDNTVLLLGEIGYETDTGFYKIGDGSTAWNSIATYYKGIPAIQSLIDTAIANLVDSSPGTLNTLNELAAALGDDANFAATVTAALAGKQASSSNLTSLSALSDPNADRILFWDDSAGQFAFLTLPANAEINGTSLRIYEKIGVGCSDLTTDLTSGTDNGFYHNRGGVLNITAVYAEVLTAPTGAAIVVDINENGSTILSTKLSIDAGEYDSHNAATPAVISDASIADNAKLTFDRDQVGSTVPGKGLVVWLVGYRS